MRGADTQASTQVPREALFTLQETPECSPEEPTGSDSLMTDQGKSAPAPVTQDNPALGYTRRNPTPSS